MNTQEEEWLTGFAEGDGYIGLNYRNRPLVDFEQKERDVLDSINSLVDNGRIYPSHKCTAWHLRFNGEYCIPLLKVFSRHIVGERFLERLNVVLDVIGHPRVTCRRPTLDWLVGFWDADGTSSNLPNIKIVQKERSVIDAVAEGFGGNIYAGDSYHQWYLCGEKALTLVSEILVRSRCPSKIGRLRANFEGPNHYELHSEERKVHDRQYSATHKEEKRTYDRRHYEEQKLVREYMKLHSEVLEEVT